MNLKHFDNMPSIADGKKNKKIIARIFIPYTINGWYIIGVDKQDNDYKMLVIEKWNTPFVLRVKQKIVLLSELLEYKDIQYDNNWKTINIEELSFIGCLQ